MPCVRFWALSMTNTHDITETETFAKYNVLKYLN